MPGGNPSTIIVQDEGIEVAHRRTLNFTGTGVTATDDAVNNTVDIASTKYTDAEAVDAVEAAGLVLAAGKNIQLGYPTSDHTYSSSECVSFTAGESLVFGDICYMKSDGKMWKAKANVATTMPGIFLAVATISAEAAGLFVCSGIVRDDTWNFTVGVIVFVSAATGGLLTSTAPAVATNFVQPVGIALTADIILMKPSLEMVEVS